MYSEAPVAKKLTHSTRLSSPNGFDASTGFLPVMSSKRTTPKENTSDFSVNLPLDAYSGAMYLNKNILAENKQMLTVIMYECLFCLLTQKFPSPV
jgi:hypothetical protein